MDSQSPVLSIADFVVLLRDCQLLSPARWNEFQSEIRPRYLQLRPLAAELLRRDWLTPYQVNQLALGRVKNLFVGPYQLLGRLGKGGMGQVYKARHGRMKRLAAIKVIHRKRLASSNALQRFQREIQLAAQLSHPNVVHAYDADLVGDVPYLAMEFVEGTDLASLVARQGPQSVGRACNFICQAALGLQHGHDHGLVHRDIKPANLLLKTEGSIVKIVDWGLARVPETATVIDDRGLTKLGKVLGSCDFIAPEQVVDSRTVDTRADVYSLGSTLYFLLTGQVPFPGENKVNKMVKQVYESPAPVEFLRPKIPAPVAIVVRRLMAKQPDERYQKPSEVAQALAAFKD
jgi:serine/threonine-protein kinase